MRPFSLRTRYLIATAAVVLSLTLAYGTVAVVGYIVNFDHRDYRLLRAESNLLYSLAQWRNNQLEVISPPNAKINYPALVYIYDQQKKLLWSRNRLPELESMIEEKWLNRSGLYQLDVNKEMTLKMLRAAAASTLAVESFDDEGEDFSHSIGVNHYPATENLPEMTIVVIDVTPQDLTTDTVWRLFFYVLVANFILIVPLLWLAAYWSLKPIRRVASQLTDLEKGLRDRLEESPLPPKELRGLVRSLNILLSQERQRFEKYQTTLADMTHSMKTPLAVLQSMLRQLSSGKETIQQAEPVMLEQISRISQQIGYYLHRASLRSEQHLLIREVHSVPALLDSLCFALNKAYQRKGVNISLDVSPELTFVGEKNDFMEIMGNLLDNACKYCLEFIEVHVTQLGHELVITIEDDGPGIPASKREIIFQRGQRIDTLTPGQGMGLSLVRELLEQYQGNIVITESPLGGAKIRIHFQQNRYSEDSRSESQNSP